MSTHYAEAEPTPLLRARAEAVEWFTAGYETSMLNVLSPAQTWDELGSIRQAVAFIGTEIVLKRAGLLVREPEDGLLGEELNHTGHRAGHAEAYKEGISGLAVNHVISTLARLGCLETEVTSV